MSLGEQIFGDLRALYRALAADWESARPAVVQGGVGMAAAGDADRLHEPGTSEAHETYVSCPQQEQARARHPYDRKSR